MAYSEILLVNAEELLKAKSKIKYGDTVYFMRSKKKDGKFLRYERRAIGGSYSSSTKISETSYGWYAVLEINGRECYFLAHQIYKEVIKTITYN